MNKNQCDDDQLVKNVIQKNLFAPLHHLPNSSKAYF